MFLGDFFFLPPVLFDSFAQSPLLSELHDDEQLLLCLEMVPQSNYGGMAEKLKNSNLLRGHSLFPWVHEGDIDFLEHEFALGFNLADQITDP